MKTYEIVKAITVPSGTAKDESGAEIGQCIMSEGVICLDPEHLGTKSFIKNGCIKEKGSKPSARVYARNSKSEK